MLHHHLQIASYKKMQVFFTSLIKQLLHELKVTLNSSAVCSPVCYLLLAPFLQWTTQCQKLHLTFSSQATIRSAIKHIFVPFWLPWETHIIISSSLESGKNAQWPGNLLFSIACYLNLKQTNNKKKQTCEFSRNINDIMSWLWNKICSFNLPKYPAVFPVKGLIPVFYPFWIKLLKEGKLHAP